MSYYPQPGSDPYDQSGRPELPLSANDPYHRPDAPRPEWQQGGGYPGGAYPGSPYPGVVDPYYPRNRPPDDSDDDEPERRFRRGWLVAIAVGVVALVLGVTVLQNSGSDSGADNPAPQVRTGELTEQWRSGAPVSMWSSALVGQMLVGIECNQRAGPHADGADCALRGRSLTDGQQRWELTGQPLGTSLIAVGDVVVVSGDGQRGDLRDIAAGKEQAHRRTLLVDAEDGRVIKTFDDQIAWMYSQQTVVLRNLPGEGGRQTFTAIDVASGEQRWRFDDAAPVNDGVNELATLLPDGFAPTPMVPGEMVVMDGATATVVRELDTGTDLVSVPRRPDDPTRYIAYLDEVLVRVVPGSNVRLEGVSTGNVDTPVWSTELGADAIVRQCSTMICVPNSQGSQTRLVHPETGEIVVTNESGAMYVRRSGDVVALLRCTSEGSFVDPCPLDKARTEVVATNTGRRIWAGKAPVFVLSGSVGPRERLVVGTTSPDSDTTEVIAISANSRPLRLGSLQGPGLVDAGEVQSEPVTDGYEASSLPTRQCGADERRLVCGTRWQLNQVMSWQLSD